MPLQSDSTLSPACSNSAGSCFGQVLVGLPTPIDRFLRHLHQALGLFRVGLCQHLVAIFVVRVFAQRNRSAPVESRTNGLLPAARSAGL